MSFHSDAIEEPQLKNLPVNGSQLKNILLMEITFFPI